MEVMGLMLGEFIDATTVSLPATSPILHSAHPSCTTDSSADLVCCLSSSMRQISCVDVFAMPQSGTSVTVESVDHVFQTKMLDMLKQTGRPEMVVGWYHSHPGFGCWLSNVDVNTQQVSQASVSMPGRERSRTSRSPLSRTITP